MILIDNIYYMFCCLYRKAKESRIEDSWRVGGGTVTVLYLGFSIWLFLTPWLSKDHDIGLYQMFGIGGLVGLVVMIRYGKYVPFDKIEEKIIEMEPKKKRTLNIFTYLFLFTCLPLAIVYAYYSK